MGALEGQVILLSRYLPHPPGQDTGMTWMGDFGEFNAGPMDGQ